MGVFGLLYKDREKYTHPIAARVALCMFIIFGFLMAVNTWREREVSGLRDLRTAERFEGVVGAIGSVRTDLTGRADATDKAVGNLTGKFDEFQQKIRPDELKIEMSGLQASVHKLLNPPKAILAFTFIPFFNPPATSSLEAKLSKEVSVTLDMTRRTSLKVSALNLSTEVSATGIDINLIICDECTFATEPREFIKLAGNPDHIRYRKVQLLNPRSQLSVIDVEINVPPNVGRFQVGISYRCAACPIAPPDMGWVVVSNPF